MRNTRRLALLGSVGCLTSLIACSDADDGPGPSLEDADASTVDGSTDLTPSDPVDAGTHDTGTEPRDAGLEDAGDASIDAGPIDTTAPVVAILTPREGLAVDERRFVVTGKATDDTAVTKLSYRVGVGAPVDVASAADGSFAFELVPTPGENVFTVTATDAAGHTTTATRSAYFGHRFSGGNSQFAMLSGGKLLTWGRNELGQLGNGTLTGSWSADTTVMLPRMYEQPANDLVSIVTRQTFMIALAKDGTVKTWGSNDAGQLGYAMPADCGTQGNTACGRSPSTVPGVTDAVAVAAGFNHSLVLKSNGTVLAFGKNDKGQLGVTGVTSTSTPTLVEGLTNVIAIGAGSSHSLALTADGKVFVWGSNQNGTFGNGAADTAAHPVPTVVPNLGDAAGIASGNDTMLVRKKDGTVVAWGKNNNGQVGNGATGDVLLPTPVLITAPANGAPGVPLTNVDSIAGDGFVSLAIDRDGKRYAWGAGSLGQLGQGYTVTGDRDLAPRSVASPIYAPGGAASFVLIELEVAAGGSTMALTNEKKLYAWGWSFQGSLGGGTALLNQWAYTAPILVYPTLAVPAP